MQSIEWRAVVGYEGSYEVSDSGQVRSLARVVMRSNGSPQKIRARELSRLLFRGYYVVTISKNAHGVRRFVHRLVAEAFIGKGEVDQEVCHGDGSRDNNAPANLRWGTRAENMQDSLLHGTNRNASKELCTRGHVFDASNTRLAKNGGMRVCIKCRKRKVPCPVCGEARSYYGMKSHLKFVHNVNVRGRSWQAAFRSSSESCGLSPMILAPHQ